MFQRRHAVAMEVVGSFFKMALRGSRDSSAARMWGCGSLAGAAGVRMATNIRTGKTVRNTLFMGSLQLSSYSTPLVNI